MHQNVPLRRHRFQLALMKNPKSVSLWREYFLWLKEAIQESDPEFLKVDLQRGLGVVGLHPGCKFVYDLWLEVENEVGKIYEVRTKMLSTVLSDSKAALEESLEWLESLSG